MSDPAGPVVTRFAPSPTGQLHIGGARTALFNYLFARRYGGKFLLRMEDTDRERSSAQFEQAILDSLDWLGLRWDGEPLYQSQRTEAYRETAEQLLAGGKAYRDYTPPEALDRLRQQAQSEKRNFRFRKEMAQSAPSSPGAPHVIRFEFPRQGTVGFDDVILGPIEAPAEEFDDFVLIRSEGSPVFHLCNVVDDIHQGVTHVIRGSDHQTNTYKHVALYAALGREAPRYAHIPLIAGPDGKKLSKRLAGASVLDYREQGYLPEALVNFLARLGWSHGDEEIFSLERLTELFDLSAVGKSMAAFNPEKLLWLNQHWMKKADEARLAGLLREHLRHEPGLSLPDDARLRRIAAIQKERTQSLREMAEDSVYFFRRPGRYDEKGRQKFLTESNLALLGAYAEKLGRAEPFAAARLEELTDGFLKERELSLKHLAQPLRVALTGGTASPGIYDVLEILGRDEVLERIEQARRLGPTGAGKG